jgi:hypothetical protein
MTNLESGNVPPANRRPNLPGLPIRRMANLLSVGALALLLVVPLPLCAQDSGAQASSPMGQLPQIAIGQQYELSQDPDNPDAPPQYQPVPNGDSDDSNMNSDEGDNNSDDNADNGDNDQNQNDDNGDNSPDSAGSDSDTPPPPPPSN